MFTLYILGMIDPMYNSVSSELGFGFYILKRHHPEAHNVPPWRAAMLNNDALLWVRAWHASQLMAGWKAGWEWGMIMFLVEDE